MSPDKPNRLAQSEEFLIVRLIPNIFTTVGMCVGLTGIRFALESEWKSAVVCVLLAAFFRPCGWIKCKNAQGYL